MTAPNLIADAGIFVSRSDVEELLATGGRLADSSGETIPIGLSVRSTGSVDERLMEAPTIRARGMSRSVDGADAAREADRLFWETEDAALDGVVDRFLNRPLARPLAKLLSRTEISPNQVTVFALTLGFIGAALIAQGDRVLAFCGAALFQTSVVIDCVDGYLARALLKEFRLGKWLDLVGDEVVHAAIFAGVAVGVARSGSGAPALILGISTVTGGLISFGVVLSCLHSPHLGRRTRRLIDIAANRDFSLIILVAAIFNRLDVFLWAAAIGVHVFWMTVLILRSVEPRTADGELRVGQR